MGRKIPAKKHHGVKDPLVQQARRLQSLKGKINAPPKDPDDQPMPRSLIRLFNLQLENSKEKKKKKKPNRFPPVEKNQNNNGKNPISKMKRLPGETGRSFSLRINSAVRGLNESVEHLDYPIDVETEDMKGEHMDEMRRRRRRRAAPAAPSLSRAQRLAAKKLDKKKLLQEMQMASQREVQVERVSFGDVASAPPALRPPRAATHTRPGERSLLLHSLLKDGRERARDAAIAAYRALRRPATAPATASAPAPAHNTVGALVRHPDASKRLNRFD